MVPAQASLMACSLSSTSSSATLMSRTLYVITAWKPTCRPSLRVTLCGSSVCVRGTMCSCSYWSIPNGIIQFQPGSRFLTYLPRRSFTPPSNGAITTQNLKSSANCITISTSLSNTVYPEEIEMVLNTIRNSLIIGVLLWSYPRVVMVWFVLALVLFVAHQISHRQNHAL